MALPSWTKRYSQQAVQESLQGQHGNFQPSQQPTQPQQQFDYKTANTDMQGQPLPAGSQQFDPLGRPYFGEGIKGTLKRYYWQLMGSPQTGLGADNWDKIVSDFQSINAQQPTYVQDKAQVQQNAQAMTDIAKRTATGLFDANTAGVTKTSDQTRKEQTALQEQINQEVARIAKENGIALNQNTTRQIIQNNENLRVMNSQLTEMSQKNIQGSGVTEGGTSLLTPLVRASQVGVTAIMDFFAEFAVKAEQTIGAQSNVQNKTDGTIKMRSELANFFLRAVPAISIFNTAKFLTAPTSTEEKAQLVEQGWDAGRIYYTGVYDQAVQEEFMSRAAAGEDPQLLAMELQNPWAELAGQLIIDPLNVVGYLSKAEKAAQVVDDATSVVKTSGLAEDAKFLNNINDLQNAGTEAEAIKKLDTFVTDVHKYFNEDGVQKVFNVQDYKALSLNASGNQMKAIRKMGNVFTWIVSSISKDGRGLDDVNDALTALVKLSSSNIDEVSDATLALTHMPSPMTYFNQDSLETSVMLRNLLMDENGVINVDKLVSKLKVENGNWKAFGNKLKGLMDDAAKFQYPSVTEMKNAAESAKKAEAIGNVVPKNTARLAEQFKQLEKTNPGLIKLAALDEVANKPRQAINKILGTFYFSLNYGFATRNYLQNNLVMLIDAGPKAWFRDGRYMSDKFIGEELAKWFDGGLLPPGIDNYKNIGQELTGTDKKLLGILPSGTTLSTDIEASASKRVYYKFFRDTMDKMLQPGRALPTLEEFKVAGFTENQVKAFSSMVKSNYGNVQKAAEEFNVAYRAGGADVWKMVDTLIPEEAYKGLKDNGMLDEIVNFTKQDGVSKEDISAFFDKMISEQKTRAMSIADDPVGMQKDSTFTRLRADLAASSEKYTDANTQSYLDQLFERSTQTRDAYVKALQEVRNKTGDPELSQFLDSLMMREPDERIRRVVQGINQNARTIIDKAKRGGNFQELWKTLGSEAQFKGSTFEEFRKAVFDYTLKERIPQEWNGHFGAVFEQSEKYASKYGQTELLQQARQINKEAQDWRTAAFRGSSAYDVKLVNAEIGTPAHANNVRTIANGYDISSASTSGASLDKKLLNIINKHISPESTKAVTVGIEEATKIPRSELSPQVSERISQEAKRLASELSGGQIEKASHGGRVGSSNPEWYKELYDKGLQKPAIDKALEKIVADHGKDKGINVERLKQVIIDNFTYGDSATGTPPDLMVLQELGADKSVLQRALDIYNEITGQDINLEKALSQSGAASKYTNLSEVPLDIAEKAFAESTKSDVAGFATRTGEFTQSSANKIPPPYIPGSAPTFARAHAETSAGALDALKQLREKMISSFGIKSVDNFDPQMAEKMLQLSKNASDKVAEGRLIAQKVGEYWRDFALLPYGETTNLDHALSYIYPYQFWYSRSYTSWAKRLASDPQIIAAYAKFKDQMANLHKDSPEWWKYNVELPEFMWGLNNGNPMYVNLEATLWPLYGITGVDFNDSRKRVDWFSATIDDLGKFGPSVWSPLNIAIAAGYALKGEQDAAARWGGRIIPQTATLKAIMAELGQTPIELDPGVMLFGGTGDGNPFHSLDPYERNRVGRALAQMIEDGVITEEQAIEVARTQTGDIWNQAVTNATALRAPGQIASFFAGVGFKARTEEDIQIDNFYQDYYKMQELHNGGLISDAQYKQQFNVLREQYPFMDTVLLSRKAGDDRQSAYAYNVISRIPPGMTKEIYAIIGVDPETAQKFYESGGSFEGWNEQEKQRFMTAMIDAGAMLAIPANASRTEWTAAKNEYKDMQDGLRANFGENVLEQISTYYDLTDAEKKAYLQTFPNVEAAMQAQTAYIANNPLLSTYYGGLNITSRYYSNEMYSQLDKEFGSDISDKIDYYYYLKDFVSDKEAKAFYNQENLKPYFKRKSELQQQTNIAIANAASNIPDGPGVLVYGEPQNPTQQGLYDFATGPSQESQIATDVWGQLSTPYQNLIRDYYNGGDLPYSVEKRLDYLARDYGLSKDELLRILGAEVVQ